MKTNSIFTLIEDQQYFYYTNKMNNTGLRMPKSQAYMCDIRYRKIKLNAPVSLRALLVFIIGTGYVCGNPEAPANQKIKKDEGNGHLTNPQWLTLMHNQLYLCSLILASCYEEYYKNIMSHKYNIVMNGRQVKLKTNTNYNPTDLKFANPANNNNVN